MSTAGFIGLAGAFFAGGADALAIVIGWLIGFVAPCRPRRALLPEVRRGDRSRFPRGPLRQPAAAGSSRRSSSLAAMLPLLVAATGDRRARGRPPFSASTCRRRWRSSLVVLLLSSLLGGMRAVTFVARRAGDRDPFRHPRPGRALSRRRTTDCPSPSSPTARPSRNSARISDTLLATLAGRLLPLARLGRLQSARDRRSPSPRRSPRCRMSLGRSGDDRRRRRRAPIGRLGAARRVRSSSSPRRRSRPSPGSPCCSDVVGGDLDDLPQWVFDFGRLGLLKLCGVDAASPSRRGRPARAGGRGRRRRFAIAADGVTLAFADIAGLPYVADRADRGGRDRGGARAAAAATLIADRDLARQRSSIRASSTGGPRPDGG